ncbi:MAG: hypothetical protein ACK522_00310 [Synechococcaceae cyanobacterium]
MSKQDPFPRLAWLASAAPQGSGRRRPPSALGPVWWVVAGWAALPRLRLPGSTPPAPLPLLGLGAAFHCRRRLRRRQMEIRSSTS